MWKFLTPAGTTEHKKFGSFSYNLPGRDEKWARTDHPEPAKPDMMDCGPGRLHLMSSFDARYAPRNWWPWYARGVEGTLVGVSDAKEGWGSIELRRVRPAVFWKMIRLGWLKGANLKGANLREADLRGADLRGADLRRADLRGADLRGADLRDSNLRYAILYVADLQGANLYGADLQGANLQGADLSWAIGR